MRFILLFLALVFFNSNSYSNSFNQIQIKGNKRITDQTVLSIINYEKNKNYSIEQLNNFQKKLYESNYFEDVKIKILNNKFEIILKENPIIDFFYVDGIKNKSRKDFIYENILLGQNKVFSKSFLKQDIEFIKKVFIESGFLDVEVTIKLSELPNNVVNLIIKVERFQEYKINRVFFIGEKKFPSSTLNDVILSAEHGWWKFLSPFTTVDQRRIEYDKKQLKNFFLNNGYYDVQISSVDIKIISKNLANIVYSINSGKRYLFNNFLIKDDNNLLSPDQKKDIQNLISESIKKIYSKKRISFIESKIYSYLNINKIEFINFNVEVINSSDLDKLDVNFNFFSSDRKFVNLINIKGNTITEEEVVRRNLILSSGDSLTSYKLKKSKDNLESSGIFENIKVKQIQINQELSDIEISVDEKPTGALTAGLGVGSSGSALSGGLTEQNLFGKGIKLNSNVSLGTEKVSGIVGFTLPDFNNTDSKLNYNIFARSVDYTNAGYESSMVGSSLSLSYPIFEDIFVTPGISFEFDEIETNSSASDLYKKRAGDYVSFKTYYDIYSDKRDSKFRPTAGHKVGFGQSLAIPGSDITHLANNIYGSYYKSLSKDYILNIKSGFDTINSLDNKDVKLSDRLFLSNSKLRGFESFGIGPKDGKDHVGGNYSYYTSVSSTVPNFLPEKWNAKTNIFIDTGNVWGVDYSDSLDSDKIRSSAGLSLDWISPLGPLSFTFAETISSAKGDLEENFNFKIGSTF